MFLRPFKQHVFHHRPAGETEQYAYDREGRPAEKADRNGVTTQYVFNMYGAPLYRRVKDGVQGESCQSSLFSVKSETERRDD